jgi:hypothetical protein
VTPMLILEQEDIDEKEQLDLSLLENKKVTKLGKVVDAEVSL